MYLIVLADEVVKQEFEKKQMNADTKVIYIESLSALSGNDYADAFFLLKDTNRENYKLFANKPVFINSVIYTLKDLDLPDNFNRLNGWPGFLNRNTWEIATTNENAVKYLFEKLGWKYIMVADKPGMASARIISMIINEAYFALGEDISTKDEIDLAMKLGTNYPYGPFEWAEKIGLENIYTLLEKLSKTDSRYNIAPVMKNELLKN